MVADIGEDKETSLIGGFTYEDGSVYEGEWNACGEKHGYGIYRLPNGECYQGRFEKDLPSGLGRLRFPDGTNYVGEFMQGWFHGYGSFQLGSGTKFDGQFRGGRIWGLGLTTFEDGSNGMPTYEGFYKDWLLVKRQKCNEIVQIVRNNAFILEESLTREDEDKDIEEKPQ